MIEKKIFAALGAAVLAGGLFFAPAAAGNAQAAAQETQQSAAEADEVSEILEFIRDKWNAGELETREDIQAAIEEGESEFGVSLDPKLEEQLADAVGSLNDLGVSPDTAVDLAKELYEKHGDEIAGSLQSIYEEQGETISDEVEKAIAEQVTEPLKEAAKAVVADTAKTFWHDLKESVVSFFQDIFS
ncbi:MAG TPA: hypothetical protein H9956_09955 [Candidatus Eisenbergiella pullicola]|nr:hypothetical protein [Candidatus Eisenbergiella pullicola]